MNHYMIFSLLVFFSVLTVPVYGSGGGSRPVDPEAFPTDDSTTSRKCLAPNHTTKVYGG